MIILVSLSSAAAAAHGFVVVAVVVNFEHPEATHKLNVPAGSRCWIYLDVFVVCRLPAVVQSCLIVYRKLTTSCCCTVAGLCRACPLSDAVRPAFLLRMWLRAGPVIYGVA